MSRNDLLSAFIRLIFIRVALGRSVSRGPYFRFLRPPRLGIFRLVPPLRVRTFVFVNIGVYDCGQLDFAHHPQQLLEVIDRGFCPMSLEVTVADESGSVQRDQDRVSLPGQLGSLDQFGSSALPKFPARDIPFFKLINDLNRHLVLGSDPKHSLPQVWQLMVKIAFLLLLSIRDSRVQNDWQDFVLVSLADDLTESWVEVRCGARTSVLWVGFALFNVLFRLSSFSI